MTREQLVKLIELEKQRKALARKKNKAAFLRTYRSATQKENKNTGKFWDHRFDVENNEGGVNFVERDRNVTSYAWLHKLLKPGTRVLNVGCGNGKFESFFNLKHFKGLAYEGIDFARKSINALNKKYPQFSFRVADILTEKFTHTFDIICMFEVLEHINAENVLAVQRKLFRTMHKGGHVLVAVPVNEPLLEMYPSNPNEHVRLYSKEVICAELESAGFEIVKIEEFIAFRSMYWLKKLLSKTLLRGRWKPNDLLILARKQ